MLAVNHKPYVVHAMWKMDDMAKYVVKIPFIKKISSNNPMISMLYCG